MTSTLITVGDRQLELEMGRDPKAPAVSISSEMAEEQSIPFCHSKGGDSNLS